MHFQDPDLTEKENCGCRLMQIPSMHIVDRLEEQAVSLKFNPIKIRYLSPCIYIFLSIILSLSVDRFEEQSLSQKFNPLKISAYLSPSLYLSLLLSLSG